MQFRKIAALAGSALMAGMTLAGAAMAANVANVGQITNLVSTSDSTVTYPLFVIGADAAPSDVAGAINVAVRLAGEAGITKTTSGAAVTADGIVFRTEIAGNTKKTRDKELQAGEDFILRPVEYGGMTAKFLKSGTVTYGGEEYKYYEIIGGDFDNTGAFVLNYDTSGSTFESQYKDVGFEILPGSIYYVLKFETPINATLLKGKTIKFLGKDYTVTDSTISEIKLSGSGSETTIAQGSTATIGEYTVEVKYVGKQDTNTVADIKVTDESGNTDEEIIRAGQTEYFVLGTKSVPIYVKNAIEGYSATVLVGSTSYKIKDGQLEGNTDWTVTLNDDGTAKIYNITLTYNKARSGFTGSYPALKTGSSISSPENFFIVKNTGPESGTYEQIEFTPTQLDMDGDGNLETGVLISTNSKIIEVGTYGFVDKVAFDDSTGIWSYINSTGGYQTFSGTPKIGLAEKSMYFSALNTTPTNPDWVINVTEPALYAAGVAKNWYIEYDTPVSGLGRFGNVSNIGATGTSQFYVSYENIPLAHNDTSPAARVGFISYYGTKLKGASISSVSIEVPKSQIYYDLIFGQEAGSATAAGTYKEAIAIKTDVVKLDTEVTDADKTSKDMVVIGGPAVNKIAAALLDKTYPTYGAASGIPENAALVKVIKDKFATGKVAVLIAGWEAADTDLACSVIQQDKLVGKTDTAVKITGTVASPVIEAA